MKYSFPESSVTSEGNRKNRRRMLKGLSLFPVSPYLSAQALLKDCDDSRLNIKEKLTDFHSITHYNNYYEFSTNKEAVAILAQELTLSPWQITISGEVEKTVTIDIDQLKQLGTCERIYPMRCVEGWSMIIPWIGVPLSRVIELAKPLSSAKFVRFESILRPAEMIGQRRATLDWPFVEGLRIDEAVHPLTLLAHGLYGKPLPPQNGAPARLVVPWKYGYKSIKAIQKIVLTRHQPISSWQKKVPSEYGFYANVNPGVPHPRWSQKREVRIGEVKKVATQLFNGYTDQVADMYRDLDLSVNF